MVTGMATPARQLVSFASATTIDIDSGTFAAAVSTSTRAQPKLWEPTGYQRVHIQPILGGGRTWKLEVDMTGTGQWMVLGTGKATTVGAVVGPGPGQTGFTDGNMFPAMMPFRIRITPSVVDAADSFKVMASMR